MFRLGRDGEARAGDPPEADDTYSCWSQRFVGLVRRAISSLSVRVRLTAYVPNRTQWISKRAATT